MRADGAKVTQRGCSSDLAVLTPERRSAPALLTMARRLQQRRGRRRDLADPAGGDGAADITARCCRTDRGTAMSWGTWPQ
jgi:hypothetical protein